MGIGVLGALIVTSMFIRVEQHLFRQSAKRLLADIRALELGKPYAADALRLIQEWGFEKISSQNKCSSDQRCDYWLQQQSPIAKIRFYGYEGQPALAHIMIWLGGRPALVRARIGVRKGNVAFKDYSVMVSTPVAASQPDSEDVAFIVGSAGTFWPESQWSDWYRPSKVLADDLKHEQYQVGTHVGTMNADAGTKAKVPWIWVQFSEQVNPRDVTRLMQFDLGCLTRLRSCRETELMPTVWQQVTEDEKASPANVPCTADVVKNVLRLADIVAILRINSVELQPPPYPTWEFRLHGATLVKLIKGPSHVRRREFPDFFEVDTPEILAVADTGAKLRVGEQYIFLMQDHMYGGGASAVLYPCGILTHNPPNAAMAQDIAGASLE